MLIRGMKKIESNAFDVLLGNVEGTCYFDVVENIASTDYRSNGDVSNDQ